MIVTYKDVQCVTFPVFKITGSNWTYSDGLLFLENQLLDDKNMSGEYYEGNDVIDKDQYEKRFW